MTDAADRQLFFASTNITIGDGKNTPFREARWLHGTAPKEIAPNLHQAARFKHRTASSEITNRRWIANLGPIDNPVLLQEYVQLYTLLSTVEMSDQADEITWKWMSDGKYSVVSAYKCQFLGAMTTLPAADIWRARAEPKCRFIAWLALHDRALTADNMAKRNCTS